MKAFVLAAGKGTRMRELAADKPKHMIEVNGRPFLYYIVKSLRDGGVDDIAILVYHLKEKIMDYVSKEFPEIKLIEQDKPLGTGHAVKFAKEFSRGEDFIVIMGDNLYSAEDISSISKMNGNVIAGYDKVDDPRRFGVLKMEGDKLIGIEEKPENPPSRTINTGLYKFTKDIFSKLDELKLSVRGEYELTDAITSLAKEDKMTVYSLKDYWMDFGKPEDVPKMEEFLKHINRNKEYD